VQVGVEHDERVAEDERRVLGILYFGFYGELNNGPLKKKKTPKSQTLIGTTLYLVDAE